MLKKSHTKASDPNWESGVTPVFVRNQSFLKRFLTRFLSSSQDIEDVVQESYLKALCAEQKKEISSPKAFLFRIARNEALKELQKKSRRITDYLDELDAQDESSSETAMEDSSNAKQRFGLFCESALEMPPRCRKAFLMCKVYGFSYKEIAAHLDISVSGVEKHVARGLEICSDYVAKNENAHLHSHEHIKSHQRTKSRQRIKSNGAKNEPEYISGNEQKNSNEAIVGHYSNSVTVLKYK